MNKGKFIFFEGMDFSGKTTCANMLGDILTTRGIKFIITREPGGTPFGDALRAMLLNCDTDNVKEQALLFQAARSNHCRNVIQPALDEGTWVLSDRYIISSMVYQHDALDIIKSTSRALNLIEPDYMVYAKCGIKTTLQRKGIRSDVNAMDELYTKNYDMYSSRFDHYACLLEDMSLNIDTNKPVNEIYLILYEFVDKILGEQNV